MDLSLPSAFLENFSTQPRGKDKTGHQLQTPAAPKSVAENSFRQRIKKLLISGSSQKEAAQAVGVSESYVSQLLSDSLFAQEVQLGRSAGAIAKVSLNETYDRIEEKLLTRLEQSVDGMGFSRPLEILRALQVVGSKKREPLIPAAPAGSSITINLRLPDRVAKKFILNSQKDVLALESQDFIPMPSSQLLQEAKASLPQAANADKNKEPAEVPIYVTTNTEDRTGLSAKTITTIANEAAAFSARNTVTPSPGNGIAKSGNQETDLTTIFEI